MLAWLNSVESREEADFPVLNNYEDWLIETVQSIGLSFGGNPMPYTEIESWTNIIQVPLTAWEVELFHFLSGIYLVSCKEYEKEDVLPPFNAERVLKGLQRRHTLQRIAQLNATRKNHG